MGDIDCMAVFKAMAEPTRLRIVRELLCRPLGVNELAGRLGLSQYNASKHLRVLRQAGLLDSTRRGQSRLYGIAPALAAKLGARRNVLELDCCTFRFDKLPR